MRGDGEGLVSAPRPLRQILGVELDIRSAREVSIWAVSS